MNKKQNEISAFTLIELLVVVAIIGILAAVGVTTYNGIQQKVKKNAAQSNHKLVVKYITNEVMKCSMGDSTAMDGNLDCSKQGSYDWKDDVSLAVEKALISFKNPWDKSKSSVTHGGCLNCSNTNVGFNRVNTPGSNVRVKTCLITPCTGGTAFPCEDHEKNVNFLCSGIIQIN